MENSAFRPSVSHSPLPVADVNHLEFVVLPMRHAPSLLGSGAFLRNGWRAKKSLRFKVLAPLALVITLNDSVALVRFLDHSGQLRGFLPC